MKGSLLQPVKAKRAIQAAKTLREALLVASAGVAFALVANFFSPRGLNPATNYFPASPPKQNPTASLIPAEPPKTNPTHSSSTHTNTAGIVFQRLENELQMINGGQAQELFQDPRYAQGAILFLDARDEQHYQAAHLPGAFVFDHYHPEKYLAEVLSLCNSAETIVVYCNGGDCEDSQFAAISLREAGVENSKLFVYGGGLTEWQAHHWPIESGERKPQPIKAVP